MMKRFLHFMIIAATGAMIACGGGGSASEDSGSGDAGGGGTGETFSVTSITPSSGNNSGTVSITSLAGTGFSSIESVKLVRDGCPDITATAVQVVSSSKITCYFNISGARPGNWDVVVTPSGAALSTLAAGFRITQLSVVDSAGDMGSYGSMAVDGDGRVHICYADNTDGHLKYATNAHSSEGTYGGREFKAAGGGFYTAELGDEYPTHVSIAVDGNGKVHIGNAGTKCVKYTTNAGGSWNTETVKSLSSQAFFTSIGVDGSGSVHIAYYDVYGSDLRYATGTAGSFSDTALETDGDVGNCASLAVDGVGKVHVSYFDSSNRSVKYATNAITSPGTYHGREFTAIGSSFYGAVIYTGGGSLGGYGSSLKVDANGRAHISFNDYSNSSLHYATNASGTWVCASIYSSPYSSIHNSLALSEGKAYISFYGWSGSYSTTRLYYATNATGSWVQRYPDTSGNSTGEYNSIAVDSRGVVHISYYDKTAGDLKYMAR